MIALDTNILIYGVDASDQRKHLRAKFLIDTAETNPAITISDQNLFEFGHAILRKKLLARADTFRMLASWSALFTVITPTTAAVLDAVALLQKFHLSVWDARLLATCAANGVSTLFSEDMQDGGQYGRVRVLDPFNPANDHIVDELLK